jgi:hypothetical protein
MPQKRAPSEGAKSETLCVAGNFKDVDTVCVGGGPVVSLQSRATLLLYQTFVETDDALNSRQVGGPPESGLGVESDRTLNFAHTTLRFTLPAVQVSVSRESIAQSSEGGATWAPGQTADEIVQGLTAAIANNVRTRLTLWASHLHTTAVFQSREDRNPRRPAHPTARSIDTSDTGVAPLCTRMSCFQHRKNEVIHGGAIVLFYVSLTHTVCMCLSGVSMSERHAEV